MNMISISLISLISVVSLISLIWNVHGHFSRHHVDQESNSSWEVEIDGNSTSQ